MTMFLRITARDPLVARDGRPFGQGSRMRSVGWLYPSVVAGSFRTVLAKAAKRSFDDKTVAELLAINVAGVLPQANGQLYFPSPCDCVVRDGTALRARPEPLGSQEGMDGPGNDIWPVVLSGSAAPDDFKPEEGPAYWPGNHYADWLCGKPVSPTSADFLGAPLAETRDHVGIEPISGTAQEGLLFTTVGLGLSALPCHRRPGEPTPALDASVKLTGSRRFDRFTEITLTARVDDLPRWGEEILPLEFVWHPLGGERRLAHWQTDPETSAWQCPPAVVAALQNARFVTLNLVTPAIFRDGWKPGWLDEQFRGTPFPGGPKLRLVGVCLPRWRAVSGWSYVANGPKAIRRVVPAGGVYFFEVLEGSGTSLVKRWLQPVSDGEQENRDGFGLAAWGIWSCC